MIARRDFLASVAALAAARPLRAQAEAAHMGAPFAAADVEARARALAAAPYAPRPAVPPEWTDLTYDEYRMIWFDPTKALWAGTDSPVQVDFFHPGLYFPRAVRMNFVEYGRALPFPYSDARFDRTDRAPALPIDETVGYSGLRLRAEIETQGVFQEFFVMQGASYFRAIGRGETYGLSARGLALNTGDPEGEEFPDFVEIWIERSAPESGTVRLHALMDSPSLSGAFRFDIAPGAETRTDVQAAIFPRAELTHLGIGALTSMFLFDETNRERFSDFRDAVHDSDGLLIENGAGERLWRPLANPKRLQVSAFADESPKGFGLMQRARQLSDFGDLEAHYHNRPGLWIEPVSAWGKGSVTLVEIPADKEIYDNIVAYWRPAQPIPAGGELRFAYRMTWGQDPAPQGEVARVQNSRLGGAFGESEALTVAIDFAPSPLFAGGPDGISWGLRASAGEITPGTLQANPETGGLRLAFDFLPGEAEVAEFRAYLMKGAKVVSEVWLYRWTS